MTGKTFNTWDDDPRLRANMWRSQSKLGAHVLFTTLNYMLWISVYLHSHPSFRFISFHILIFFSDISVAISIYIGDTFFLTVGWFFGSPWRRNFEPQPGVSALAEHRNLDQRLGIAGRMQRVQMTRLSSPNEVKWSFANEATKMSRSMEFKHGNLFVKSFNHQKSDQIYLGTTAGFRYEATKTSPSVWWRKFGVSIWRWYFMRNADMGIQCKKIWHVGNALSNDDMRWQAIFRTYEPSRNVGAEMGEWFVPGLFDPLFGEDYHGWS